MTRWPTSTGRRGVARRPPVSVTVSITFPFRGPRRWSDWTLTRWRMRFAINRVRGWRFRWCQRREMGVTLIPTIEVIKPLFVTVCFPTRFLKLLPARRRWGLPFWFGRRARRRRPVLSFSARRMSPPFFIARQSFGGLRPSGQRFMSKLPVNRRTSRMENSFRTGPRCSGVNPRGRRVGRCQWGRRVGAFAVFPFRRRRRVRWRRLPGGEVGRFQGLRGGRLWQS